MKFAKILAGGLALAVLAAACTSRSPLPLLPQGRENSAISPNFPAHGDVYAGMPGQVAVFAPTGRARIATLPQGSLTAAALTFGASATLYVGDQVPASGSYTCNPGGSVNLYNAGVKAAKRRIRKGIACPIALAIRGTSLYVLDANNRITVYNRKTGALLRTITKGLQTPNAMVMDGKGNLYVANVTGSGSSSSGTGIVAMYPPNASAPSKTIPFMHSIPTALAVDSNNDLYVGSVSNQPFVCASNSSSGGPIGLVAQLAPNGSSTVVRKISGIFPVTALALDASNNLYVAGAIQTNACASSSSTPSFTGGLYVFAPGSGRPSRTLGLNDPYLLALDATADVYVADCTDNVCSAFLIREIAAGGTKLLRNLALPGQPTALAVGP